MAGIDNPDISWQQRLHAKLDAIIALRAKLEEEAGVGTPKAIAMGLSYAHLATTPVAPKARVLMREAAALAADAVGEPLRCAAFQMPANDGAGQRAALREWLSVLDPILDLPRPTFFSSTADQILEEHVVWLGLRALDVGEVREIFQPRNRGNRPANSFSLSIARLTALEWKRRLMSLGYSEGDANREITAAFGEQWDTIRKWEASCGSTLGEAFVAASLRRAEHDEKARADAPGGLFGARRQTSLERLRFHGEQYKVEKRRAAELSPAKQRAARRLEKVVKPVFRRLAAVGLPDRRTWHFVGSADHISFPRGSPVAAAI